MFYASIISGSDESLSVFSTVFHLGSSIFGFFFFNETNQMIIATTATIAIIQ